MNTIKATKRMELLFSKDYLLNDKYLAYAAVSARLKEIELESGIEYRDLRAMLHNSHKCGKYNTAVVGGVLCFDAFKPMASENASLVLKFNFKD